MLSSLPPASPTTPARDEPVRDVTLATFMAEVIEASRTVPVIVDFWAPWCGPCKQLGPVLEKLVREKKGAVRLARINSDENPEIARQMRVQSIPAVFAFFGGQPLDGFMGALPESQLRAWLDRLLKATGGKGGDAGTEGLEEALAEAAELLARKETLAAQGVYAEILAAFPDNGAAYAGFVRSLVALGALEEAERKLAETPEALLRDPAIASARVALELARQAAKPGGASREALRQRLEADPGDHAARFDLALAQYAAGEAEDAINSLLEIARRQRGWNEDAARKQLLQFFEALGPTDPLTIAGRKKLSSLLFS